MIYTVLGTMLKILGYFALFCYIVWFLRVIWRLITQPGKCGRLPWL